jgi:hypothetical protein
MAEPPSATLPPLTGLLLEQLRRGNDLSLSLSALKPGDARGPQWLTSVRVRVSGPSMARNLEGSLLVVALVAVPEITVPDLRWEPPNQARVKR